MGEAFWAAREGDALLHTSFLADSGGQCAGIRHQCGY
ncbi:Rhs-family protein [Salmonella enterica subsp. enterica]|uniref:Rhs-family protein n=1 Tax=Salmonella enterica I TaxID=59201 RepID=A0A447MXK1_SALET|nr:Rhs-family protein [Salmonella enterica subsp. enterica]